jgi:hypothetical protein
MKRLATTLVLLAAARAAWGQSLTTNYPASTVVHPAPASTAAVAPPPIVSPAPVAKSAPKAAAKSPITAPITPLVQAQAQLAQAQQDNRDLLDLLKKQQSVLADIQYDRRLQSRQIESLEERLEETLQQKNALDTKVAKLEAEAALRTSMPAAPVTTGTPVAASSPDTNAPPAPGAEPPPAPAPESYLPAAPETPTDQMGWHRIFTLKGTESRQTDLFKIQGKQWRVLWHNQDKPGKTYVNTSALFINAFPRDDTIPQRICSKLGSGGDLTDLQGAGNYYLKIEASGGSWEVAVEEMR